MTKRDWAVLGCRILALYFLGQGIVLLAGRLGALWAAMAPGVISQMADFTPMVWSFYFLEPLAEVLLGFVVWMLAPLLARKIAADGSDTDLAPVAPSGALGREGALEVALVVLGLFLVVTGIRQAIFYAFQLAESWTFVHAPSYRLGTLIGAVLQMAIGLWLVVGTKRVVSLIQRLRTAGR